MTASSFNSHPILDSHELWRRFDNDGVFINELTDLFFETSSLMIAQIHEATRAGDRQTIRQVAHSLKGVVSNFVAQPAFDAARRLEEAARHDNPTRLAEASHRLEHEVQRLCAALDHLRRHGADARPTAG